MGTNDDGKISFLLIGLGLGAIGGLIVALLAREENREALRERSARSLEFLNQKANMLRETTEAIVEKGKQLMSPGCCSGEATMDQSTQAHQVQRHESSGGG